MVSRLAAETKNEEVVLLKGTGKMALIIQKALQDKPEEKKVIPFVQTENNSEGARYLYLEISSSGIKEKYLFDPLSFKNFVQKGQCETLWHGCEEPSLLRIMEHAKNMYLQKEEKTNQ